MAALRYSAFIIVFLVSCAHSGQSKKISIENQVTGCFTLTTDHKVSNDEPVHATLSVGLKKEGEDCPCKSALFKYSTFQKTDGSISNLMSGYFTTIGKSTVALPIAVQSQLIFADKKIEISISCANP